MNGNVTTHGNARCVVEHGYLRSVERFECLVVLVEKLPHFLSQVSSKQGWDEPANPTTSIIILIIFSFTNGLSNFVSFTLS